MFNFPCGSAKTKTPQEDIHSPQQKIDSSPTHIEEAKSKDDSKELSIDDVKVRKERFPNRAATEDEIVLRKFWKRTKIQNKQRKVFLMLGGSFNPVHKEHIQIMEIARRHCEKHLNLFVVAGFLGVSSAYHVKRKLGSSSAITLKHRNKMCELAVENNEWISVCPYGWANATSIARRLQKSIQLKDEHMKVEFFNVTGSDIFGNVMPNEYGFRPFNQMLEDYICVSRDHCKVFEAVRKLKNNRKTFYFAEGSSSGSISSTRVRDLLKAEDYDPLQDYLDSKVLLYLKQNVGKIWESCVDNGQN
jgi:nicotinate (nicotinamide) nucleotide adenylyltransferase